MRTYNVILISLAVLFLSSCGNDTPPVASEEKTSIPQPCVNAVWLTDSTIILKGANLDSSLKDKGVECWVQLHNLNGGKCALEVRCDISNFQDSICIVNIIEAPTVRTNYATLNYLDSTLAMVERSEKLEKKPLLARVVKNKQDKILLLNSLDECLEMMHATIWIYTKQKNMFYRKSSDSYIRELFHNNVGVNKSPNDCNEVNYPNDLYYVE